MADIAQIRRESRIRRHRRTGIGQALYFADDGRELITSAVCGVERPVKEVVDRYAADSAHVQPVSVCA